MEHPGQKVPAAATAVKQEEIECLDSGVFSSFSYTGNLRRSKSSRGVEGGKEDGRSCIAVREAPAEGAVKLESDDIEDFGTPTDGSPPNWREIMDKIRLMRVNQDAPVDQMGTHQLADKDADEKTQQFHLLVAAMISSQTRDAVTSAAMLRLRKVPGGLTIHNLSRDDITNDQLADILKPVGFYRQKAKHLKSIAEKLNSPPYNGSVPSTLDELLKLPGVGPKVGLLVLCVAFGRGEEGLIVDTNVRRVCCRLGWAREGSNPAQVKACLEPWLPRSLWAELSFLFVGFGQQVCKPIKPQCDRCMASSLCPSAASPDLQGPTPKKQKRERKK